MRMSKAFGKTLRQVPAEAETASHRLLLRAGMVAPISAGVYAYQPLGWKVVRKIEHIIRSEMDEAGGHEEEVSRDGVRAVLEVTRVSGLIPSYASVADAEEKLT